MTGTTPTLLLTLLAAGIVLLWCLICGVVLGLIVRHLRSRYRVPFVARFDPDDLGEQVREDYVRKHGDPL